MIPGNFNNKLKEARVEADLSQRSLGLSVGLSDKTISSYESGRSYPSLDILSKIADVLNKPLEYFISTPDTQNIVDDHLRKVSLYQEKICTELEEIKKLLK